MAENPKKPLDYGAGNIQVLEGLEAVRKRPSMYIGNTSKEGFHHLVYEIVDNSIDEALAGFCTEILVTIHEDESISVKDNGRGIPVDMHSTGRPAVEVALTVLHAGGKFGGGGYKVSGGLHGVGMSVVNALSEWLTVKVCRDGKIHFQSYHRGNPDADLEVIGTTKERGTEIRFYPDIEIFRDVEPFAFETKTLVKRLRELAYLNKGVSIRIKDERDGADQVFHYEGGIQDYVTGYINHNRTVLHPVIYLSSVKDDFEVEFAFQYSDNYTEQIFSYANNIHTHEGGTHETGFKTALTRVVNNYARNNNILKAKDPNLGGEDIREGMAAVISVKVLEPQFEGQTKTKLGNRDISTAVDSITSEFLTTYFEEHPKIAKEIISKATQAFRAREAARKARETARKSNALEKTTLPGKLTDCSSKDPSVSELFIVEGDSAGGSAKQGRNPENQAILPLRGKILNVQKARIDRIMGNAEIQAMITAMGTGHGKEFDIEKARYHKLIIMTDADVDGAHIRTLLLTFLYHYMPKLIEAGYVYIAQPPLYRVRKGKSSQYVFDDAELEELKKTWKSTDQITVQRFKGLGEMNAEELWETTMDPENRSMLRVHMLPQCSENWSENLMVDEIFHVLMGEQVEPRRKFISENA
ncbi:MAG: DNA topoisomerase (ATP-hydrolyzing) subunit B, partial [Firmicutes bacterium]|nr:DNA topoisomerase (ATP-hydrolyzing) subunit B [Bacillota bacterium]